MSDQPRSADNLKRDMLPGLLDELGRTRRRRALRARLGSAAAVVALFAVAAMFARVSIVRGPAASSPLAGSTEIQIVHSDATALARWAVTSNPQALAEATAPPSSGGTLIQILSDTQLLDALAAAGRPAGLVRSQGRIWLTRDVTDPLPDAPG